MTEQEILQQIETIKNKKVRSIYDFNKLRSLQKQLEDISNERNQTREDEESD